MPDHKEVETKKTSALSFLLPLLLLALLAIGSYYLLGAHARKSEQHAETHQSAGPQEEHSMNKTTAGTPAQDTVAQIRKDEVNKAAADTQAHQSAGKAQQYNASKATSDTQQIK